MAKQPTVFRVKALKQFKASIDGALPIMVHPDDVVEVDRFLCGMLVSAGKAELTEEKVRIDKEWVAPVPPAQATDTLTAVLYAVQALTKVMGGGKFAAKGV